MKFLIFITTALTLASCTSTNLPPAITGGMKQYSTLCDNIDNYCITVGETMNNRNWTSGWTGQTGIPTAYTLSNGLKPDDSLYSTMDVYKNPDSINCASERTGALEVESIFNTNGKTTWGKVDFFDKRGWDYLPEEVPICRPPGGGAAYALCTEKDGKTILICISEVTDNPQLAEEIFQTFRWID